MKRLLIILICAIFSITISAQEAMYITGTFRIFANNECPFKVNGLNRTGTTDDIFFFTNLERDYSIELDHLLYENSTNNPVIINLPIAELDKLENVIKADDLLKFETSDDAYRWMLTTKKSRVKVYIIDSNDFYKSDQSLDAPDMMKLIEVRISYMSIPDHILNPL